MIILCGCFGRYLKDEKAMNNLNFDKLKYDSNGAAFLGQ